MCTINLFFGRIQCSHQIWEKYFFSLKKYIFLEEQATQLTQYIMAKILWIFLHQNGGWNWRGKEEERGEKGILFFHASNVSIYFAFEIFLTSVVCSRKVLTYIVPLFDLSVKYACKQISSAIWFCVFPRPHILNILILRDRVVHWDSLAVHL